eukprot:TRINITY_DN10780_c0_g2_i1.p1 TRINITY_DN10780_c0_g2~~TRINITY_DN10780_c0_g2_i1.p1  ORF type:complete len:368 (-),score=88.83 TRINITY_DN10780_c0_g2_i1:945-2048(-)
MARGSQRCNNTNGSSDLPTFCKGVDTLCNGTCGDGVIASGEECDDGAANSTCCFNCRFALAGSLCRAANGTCDSDEVCTGTDASCPPDVYANSSVVCRPSVRPCDIEETCTGDDPWCPADAWQANNTACDNFDNCTVADTCVDSFCVGVDRYCDGVCGDGIIASAEQCDPGTNGSWACCNNVTCQFLSPLTVCRGSAGPCDAAETCSGSSPDCPADAFLPPTTLCHDVTRPCDIAEFCPGDAAQCPADVFSAVGSSCNSSNGCMANETCADTASGIYCIGVDRYCRGQCGDGIVAQAEQCDPGADGVWECCSRTTCQLLPAGQLCRAANGSCDVAETALARALCAPRTRLPAQRCCATPARIRATCP